MRGSTARLLVTPVLTVRPAVRATGRRRLLRAVRAVALRRALLLGAILVALCMVRVWLRAQMTTVGYEMADYREMLGRLEHEHQELEIEVASLRDPRRVDEIARHQLGLVDPQRGQVVEVR